MSVSNWPCETTLPTSDDVKSTHDSDPLFFKLSRRNISQDTTAPFLKLVFTVYSGEQLDFLKLVLIFW